MGLREGGREAAIDKLLLSSSPQYYDRPLGQLHVFPAVSIAFIYSPSSAQLAPDQTDLLVGGLSLFQN